MYRFVVRGVLLMRQLDEQGNAQKIFGVLDLRRFAKRAAGPEARAVVGSEDHECGVVDARGVETLE